MLSFLVKEVPAVDTQATGVGYHVKQDNNKTGCRPMVVNQIILSALTNIQTPGKSTHIYMPTVSFLVVNLKAVSCFPKIINSCYDFHAPVVSKIALISQPISTSSKIITIFWIDP